MTTGRDRLYVEVDTEVGLEDVPESTRRLAMRALSRSPSGSRIRLRWCRAVADDDPRFRSLRGVSGASLGDMGETEVLRVRHTELRSGRTRHGLAFLAADTFHGGVFAEGPDEVWLNADMASDQVDRVVAHEIEHTRLLRLSGPARSVPERAIHEFAAAVAGELARPGAVSLALDDDLPLAQGSPRRPTP